MCNVDDLDKHEDSITYSEVSIETFVKVPRAMMGGKCQNAMK